MDMKEFLKERITDNKKQFTNEELSEIEKNFSLVKKFYLLGLLDSANAILGGNE